MFINKN